MNETLSGINDFAPFFTAEVLPLSINSDFALIIE